MVQLGCEVTPARPGLRVLSGLAAACSAALDGFGLHLDRRSPVLTVPSGSIEAALRYERTPRALRTALSEAFSPSTANPGPIRALERTQRSLAARAHGRGVLPARHRPCARQRVHVARRAVTCRGSFKGFSRHATTRPEDATPETAPKTCSFYWICYRNITVSY